MSFIGKKKREWQESAWLLGICENGFNDLKAGKIHWINEGKYKGKKWFADPFILDYDKKSIRLLVEEFDYQVHRGRVAKLTVDRECWEVTDCKILLDLDTHLSFPMIWREDGTTFVCPESYQSGGWNMYRYDATNDKLEFVQQIIDMKLTDATIVHDGVSYWIFSTYIPKPNGSELTIWKSSELKGPYLETQLVKFKENIGRNAGMMFRYEDKIIRPAQESNHVYGHSMSFQKVVFDNDKFCFQEIYRFQSPHPIYDAGTHTYNQYNDMAVIDVKGYRYRKMAKLIDALGSMLVKIGIKKPYIIQ